MYRYLWACTPGAVRINRQAGGGFFGGGAEYGEAAGCPIFKSLLARFAVFLGFFFLNFKFEILILGVLTFFLKKNLGGVFLIPSDYGDHVFTGELGVFFFFSLEANCRILFSFLLDKLRFGHLQRIFVEKNGFNYAGFPKK